MKNPQFYHHKNQEHPELDSLQLAKDFLYEHWKKTQITCPCCQQDVKLRKRKMSSNQAYILYVIFKESKYDWVHVKELLREKSLRNNNDWTLFRFWGILEPKTNGTKNKSLGLWRITQKGVDFLMGKITAVDHILMYNNKIFPSPQEEIREIYFKNALEKHFNFSEIMADVSGEAAKWNNQSNLFVA